MARKTIEKHPLEKRAKDIEMMVSYWDKTNAIVEGLDAIKRDPEQFLPKFPKETDNDYTYRVKLSKLTNVYRDVLEGLATKPFEQPVSLIGDDIPEMMEEFIKDVDGSGNNITMFCASSFFNGINNGIEWILVDYPRVINRNVTIAEAKKQNIRPFWSRIAAHNVLEVRTKMIGSKELITYFRVFEPSMEYEVEDRVRVYERVQIDAGQPIVQWTLYERNPKATKPEDQFIQIDTDIMSIDVIPIVAFWTGRRDGKSFKFYPVMQDAVDLQVTLFQNESALEYIKTLAGYPMLAANGIKPERDDTGNVKPVSIGPGRVLYGPTDGQGNNGEWKFIEPNANSMEFLQKNIDKTKQDLRELGRQPLTALSTQLTTVTTSIAAGKARSAVSAWALGLQDAIENCILLTAMWMNIEYDPEVNVYTGFDNVANDNSDLEELGKARERGDLSQETYWEEMKRRKVLSPEFKAESERERLLNEIPVNEPDSPVIDENQI